MELQKIFYIRRHLEVDIHEGVFIEGVHQEDPEAYVPVLEVTNCVFKKIKHLKKDDWLI